MIILYMIQHHKPEIISQPRDFKTVQLQLSKQVKGLHASTVVSVFA